ncbi:E3 ubiquitin-protein ligase RNF133-like [Durio zibethinus]|uniref:RING-type E3 ubiquitin transferase n=1 Tax=Durio zibethinus TaxID=66656 RepID=A0A6P5ZLC6_DURZI|nr:E3 ubiquitin-protein ligase RNF133-like [Durio zibethinus]
MPYAFGVYGEISHLTSPPHPCLSHTDETRWVNLWAGMVEVLCVLSLSVVKEGSFNRFFPNITTVSKLCSVNALKYLQLNSGCPICFEDFPVNQVFACLPCSHLYRSGCIHQWLNRNNSCPLYRFKLARPWSQFRYVSLSFR